MSEPSPEVYEQGRGMDAHNRAMREIRARNDQSYDPREPTRVWIDEDLTPDGFLTSLTIILNTGGCRWARAGGCTMCGYVAESVEGGQVAHEDLLTQVEVCLDHEREHADDAADMVKIYTSGSFLDEREVGAKTRRAIAETFTDRERIVVESLPDFVDREKIADFTERGLDTDVAIGLETATDRVRHDCVNKYFDFADFEAACTEAQAAGAAGPLPDEQAAGAQGPPPDEQAAGAQGPPPDEQAAGAQGPPPDEQAAGAQGPPPDEQAGTDGADAGVKAYLLMKPPFLSEAEAVADMKRSVRRCAGVEGCHTVSMNPTNVQRHTMVEDLYHAGGYRPPWLWSVCEVLASTADVDAIVVSDPVGHGSDRGPHNCGECDDRAQRAIKDFDERQDPAVFDQVSCTCERTWSAVLDRERSYSLPLVR